MLFHFNNMREEIKYEISYTSGIILQAVENLMQNFKQYELSEVIVSMFEEAHLQKKFNNIKAIIPKDFVPEEGYYRDCTDFFLSRTKKVLENYDFACQTSPELDSVKHLLVDFYENGRVDIICMLIISLAYELIYLQKYKNLKLLEVARYLISEEDREVISKSIFECLQSLNDRYPGSFKGDDEIAF